MIKEICYNISLFIEATDSFKTIYENTDLNKNYDYDDFEIVKTYIPNGILNYDWVVFKNMKLDSAIKEVRLYRKAFTQVFNYKFIYLRESLERLS